MEAGMNRRFFFGTILGAFVGSRLQPEIPRFTSGGYVDWHSATLAMLHGPETIIPLHGWGVIGGAVPGAIVGSFRDVTIQLPEWSDANPLAAKGLED